MTTPPTPPRPESVATALRAKDRLADAEREFREALAQAHESGVPWREIGRALDLAASTCMRQALKVRPSGWAYKAVPRA